VSDKARGVNAAKAPRKTSRQRPIVMLALAGLEKGQKEPYALTAGGRARLLAALKAKARAPDFGYIVLDVARLAAFLHEKKRSPLAAKAIMDVVLKVVPSKPKR
jgi:hypothetical protein